jgi:hypothetical protein
MVRIHPELNCLVVMERDGGRDQYPALQRIEFHIRGASVRRSVRSIPRMQNPRRATARALERRSQVEQAAAKA